MSERSRHVTLANLGLTAVINECSVYPAYLHLNDVALR